MSRLTFSTFWKWFADDYSPTRTVSEFSVFLGLFAAYFEGPNGRTMDETMLSAVKKGRAFLPKNLINTYCETDKNVKALELAVKNILCGMFGIGLLRERRCARLLTMIRQLENLRIGN